MAEKMIKVLLFTWFQNQPSPVNPDETVRMEKLSRLGEVVDIDDDLSLQRGEELDAFFSDEDREAIEEGTYEGEDATAVYQATGVIEKPAGLIEPVDGEGLGLNPGQMSAEEMADYIQEHNLNAEQTIALAGDDTESIEKVLDAENIATDNEPRKSVTNSLEKKLQTARA